MFLIKKIDFIILYLPTTKEIRQMVQVNDVAKEDKDEVTELTQPPL